MAQRPQPTTRTESTENTGLLSGAPPPLVNRTTRPDASMASGSGNGTGTASGVVWSMFQLAHGVGETVRGTILGALDDIENRGEQKHHDIARAGRNEMFNAAKNLGLPTWGAGADASGPSQGGAAAAGYDASPDPPGYTPGSHHPPRPQSLLPPFTPPLAAAAASMATACHPPEGLLKLNDDLFLALTGYLDAEDLLAFLSTCHAIRSLASHPTLWLHAIHRLEHVRLHPVLSYEDPSTLATLPIQHLQSLVVRAVRILRNLSSESANPGPRLTFLGSFPSDGGGIGSPAPMFIPGTRFMLVQERNALVCWDVVEQRRAAHFPTAPNTRLFETPCVWLPGSTRTALFSGGITHFDAGINANLTIQTLLAIYVDFADIKNPWIYTLESPFVGKTTRTYATEHFLAPTLMGFSTETEIVWWDWARGEISTRSYPFPVDQHNEGITAGLLYDPTSNLLCGFAPAFHDMQRGDASIHLVPLAPVSTKPDSDPPLVPTTTQDWHALSTRFPNAPSLPEYRRLHSWTGSDSIPPVFVAGTHTTAKFGVFAVTHRSFFDTVGAPGQGETASERYFHFFTAAARNGRESDVDWSRAKSIPYLFPYEPGAAGVWHGVGSSGRYIAVNCPVDPSTTGLSGISASVRMGNNQTRKPLVGLLCLRPVLGMAGGAEMGESTAEMRRFEVDREPPRGTVAVDDILGLVTIRDMSGMVTVYSYSGDWGKGSH
uniref:F-box domain-containing protein n=1 Tax=Mycena chlorophos TaxID=658473 RepID=A0ABQ0LNK0_MYCCL|nr:predicted protein [Mycena chlorophos]